MSNMLPYSQLDSRVQKNFDLLYEAFNDLLKVKHYTRIDVKEITKIARVSRGTFYNHFHNIDEFIVFCSREGLRRSIYSNFPPDTFQYNQSNLKTIISWIYQYIQSTYDDWHIQWDEALFTNATRIELFNYFVDWLGTNTPMIKPGKINNYSMILSSALTGTGLAWCHDGCLESIDDLAKNSHGLLANGLFNIMSC